MIECEINQHDKILYIMPKGDLSKEDYYYLDKELSNYINRGNHIEGVLINTVHVPHWVSFDAISAHLELIKEKGRSMKKVAVVSNNKNVLLLTQLTDFFTDANVQYFKNVDKDEAIAWLKF